MGWMCCWGKNLFLGTGTVLRARALAVLRVLPLRSLRKVLRTGTARTQRRSQPKSGQGYGQKLGWIASAAAKRRMEQLAAVAAAGGGSSDPRADPGQERRKAAAVDLCGLKPHSSTARNVSSHWLYGEVSGGDRREQLPVRRRRRRLSLLPLSSAPLFKAQNYYSSRRKLLRKSKRRTDHDHRQASPTRSPPT